MSKKIFCGDVVRVKRQHWIPQNGKTGRVVQIQIAVSSKKNKKFGFLWYIVESEKNSFFRTPYTREELTLVKRGDIQ